MVERNEGRVIDLECRYAWCGKVYKLKGEAGAAPKTGPPSPSGEGLVRVLEVWYGMRNGGGVFE